LKNKHVVLEHVLRATPSTPTIVVQRPRREDLFFCLVVLDFFFFLFVERRRRKKSNFKVLRGGRRSDFKTVGNPEAL